MRGRPRTPTNLRLVTGDKHTERINPNEPEYETEIPEPPPELSLEARIEWNRITPILETMGLVCGANLATLAQYCQCYARWLKAEAEIQKNGEICIGVVFNKSGHTMAVQRKNPWVDIALKNIQECRKLANEFGMTPASQGKVSAKPPAVKPKEKGQERFFK